MRVSPCLNEVGSKTERGLLDEDLLIEQEEKYNVHF